MAPDTDKYHVVGVGCASAVPLMRLVGQSLSHHPGKLGLVVAAESMSGILMGARADDAKAKVVGSAIFGDGCAAALLDEDPGAGGPEIVCAKVHQIAGTLDAVSLELAPEDSYLHLNRDLPDVAAADLGELADDFLARRPACTAPRSTTGSCTRAGGASSTACNPRSRSPRRTWP